MSEEKKPSVTFLPERYIRRDTEVLATRLTEGPDAGKWQVIDDRGRKSLVENEDFLYEYEENEAHGGPGKINILLPGVNALGCRAVVFGPGDVSGDVRPGDAANAGAIDASVTGHDGANTAAADSDVREVREAAGLDAEINEWFERPEHFGLAAAHFLPLPDGRVIAFVTRPLTEREVKERAEVGEGVRNAIDEKHRVALDQQAQAIEAATKAETEAREKAEADIAELKRLAPIAKRHIENCKGGKNG